MALPIVAIVGRPNVGKSSLLNCLVGKRISIVDPTAGVTRDRVSALLSLDPGYVELVDTGGFGIDDVDDLTDHVASQIRYAVAEAEAIVFVVDVVDGVLPLDVKVAELLRRQTRPVVLAANKCDDASWDVQIGEFAALGFGDATPVSALHGRGREGLLTAVAEVIPDRAAQVVEPVMKLAIVGKRNAGKSTFINALAGEDRLIVSETPGTTRDSVDVRFSMGKSQFVAIDTAGVRKRSKFRDDIEFYGAHRAHRSIRRADVVLLFIDAVVSLGQIDKQLARYILEQFKPVIFVVNKWDQVGDRATQEDYRSYIDEMMPHLPYAPISFISSTQELNVSATVRLAMELHRQADTRVTTGQLNRAVEQILALRGPSQKHGKKPAKVFYVTQVSTCPPTLVLFVNSQESFDTNYQRFLLKELRSRLPFREIPIRLLFRPHSARYAYPP